MLNRTLITQIKIRELLILRKLRFTVIFIEFFNYDQNGYLYSYSLWIIHIK
jgi:hypothetical protein